MRLLRQIWITLAVLVGAVAASWVVYKPDATQRGTWQSDTGAYLLHLTAFTATLYSETRQTCLQQIRFPAHLKLVEWAEGATITAEGDRLDLSVDGAFEPLTFTRINALPAACGPADPETATPRAVFDTMWDAMDAHYAFFDLYGVDWDARRDLAPAPDATMTDAALLDLLMTALDGLDDGHIRIGTPFGVRSPRVWPDWARASPVFDRGALTQIARRTVGADLTLVEQTAIEYTLLANGVGYVLIPVMDINTPFGAQSGPAMALAFEEVATAMADARALILDIRYNPGGSDTIAFGIASHFTDTALPVFTKTSRLGDGQSTPFTAALAPFDDTALDMDVVILTSELTGSAAEIFALAMRELPQVTVMGTPTSGAMSDILDIKLPNGWDLGLSNQTYRAMDGSVFEGVGIPPDVMVPVDVDALLAGEDATLRAAFDRLR
ncbi:S41 family peptidase [Pseudooctadecabacter sp.]|uniref:S41 family peptidase n=1 Tax=Pseudooctadecabacter sp. TaxID=1966338 RepID=UPI0025E73841|nr:S41 family peptidase [Pseudooctadecabacter sp.]